MANISPATFVWSLLRHYYSKMDSVGLPSGVIEDVAPFSPECQIMMHSPRSLPWSRQLSPQSTTSLKMHPPHFKRALLLTISETSWHSCGSSWWGLLLRSARLTWEPFGASSDDQRLGLVARHRLHRHRESLSLSLRQHQIWWGSSSSHVVWGTGWGLAESRREGQHQATFELN